VGRATYLRGQSVFSGRQFSSEIRGREIREAAVCGD
jgi:hypothetical protein